MDHRSITHSGNDVLLGVLLRNMALEGRCAKTSVLVLVGRGVIFFSNPEVRYKVLAVKMNSLGYLGHALCIPT